MTSVRFHPDARAEAREAATWYRARSVAAARGFALILDEAIRTICEHPAAWPPWPDPVADPGAVAVLGAPPELMPASRESA